MAGLELGRAGGVSDYDDLPDLVSVSPEEEARLRARQGGGGGGAIDHGSLDSVLYLMDMMQVDTACANAALNACNGDISAAVDWIVNNGNNS